MVPWGVEYVDIVLEACGEVGVVDDDFFVGEGFRGKLCLVEVPGLHQEEFCCNWREKESAKMQWRNEEIYIMQRWTKRVALGCEKFCLAVHGRC